MIIIRSFLASAPFEQLESRTLTQGALAIGRDPACDWRLPDPDAKISRRHCTLTYDDGKLTIIDSSTNGVEVGSKRVVPPKNEPSELKVGDAILLGGYILTTELAGDDANADGADSGGPGAKLDDVTQAELLSSFCEGAGLEPGAYAGQDALAVMGSLGEIYRQMIEDMCDMLRDRAHFKAEMHLDRTTVGGWKNNPFKWAPGSSIAVDLVKEGSGGFLKGAEAIAESFRDLRAHCEALSVTGRGSSRAIIEALSPENVRAAAGAEATPETILKEYEDRIRRLMAHIAESDQLVGNVYRQALKEARLD